MEAHTIITTLRERQGDAHLTDGEMARKLGISRTFWRRLVSGERQMSLRVLQGAIAAYPDLAPQGIDVILPRN